MSSLRESLPGEMARRWLARVFSPRAMESVFDPFLADLQADWLHAKSTQSARYTRWSLFPAYVSLVAQIAAFAIGSLFGPSYELAPAASSGASNVDGGMPASRTSRYAAPLVIAALITFGLFSIMSALIASQPGEGNSEPSIPLVLTRLPDQPDPIVEPKTQLPEMPEVIPRPHVTGITTTQQPKEPTGLPEGPADGWIESIGPGFTEPDVDVRGSDQSEIPIVRIEPVYPQRALDRGIEGWVDVEFTVTEVGSISEPTILHSHPSGIFNRAALRAIERWKYEPKVVDGQPVSRPGMRNRFRFKMNEAGPGSN
jgi:protein TonB